MAGLSRVGRWFTESGPAKPIQGTTQVTTTGEFEFERSHRIRNSGYRVLTDESSNMPDSSEILRHIASSSRGNFTAQRFDPDHARESSFASDLGGDSWQEQPDMPNETDAALSAEADPVKQELTRDHAEAEGKELHRNSPQVANEEYPSLDNAHNRKPQRHSPVLESAAARLQKQHEIAQQELSTPSPQRIMPAPPSTVDFPDLSRNRERTQVNHQTTNELLRRPSYAAVAVIGVKDAIDRDFPGSQKTHGSDMTSDGLASATTIQSSFTIPSDTATSQTSIEETGRAHVNDDLEDVSVIITPLKIHRPDASNAIKTSPRSPGKSAPRFAQPTQAFSRRADETLRRESVSPASRSLHDGQKKSLQSTTQRQQKRKSLPGGWVNNVGTSSSEATPTKDAIPSTKTDSGKKTSSFMSPTKATTRREIATIGQETMKRTSPRVQKSLPRLNTTISPGKIRVTTSHPSATTTSATPDSSTSNPARKTLIAEGNETISSATSDNSLPFSTGSNSTRPPRRSTIGSPSSQIVAGQMQSTGVPTISNTTMQRRGSHGHLLLPIKAKLSRFGLWNDSLASDDLHDQTGSTSTALPTVNEAVPQTPQHVSIQEPIAPPAKVVPPHILYKQKMEAEKKANSNTTPATPLILASDGSSRTLSFAPITVSNASQTPSLRATAAEFKPMFRPGAFENALDEFIKNGGADYKSSEEWASYSSEERQVFLKARELLGKHRSLSATMPNGSPFRTSKASNRRYWEGLAAQQGSISYDSPGPLRDATNASGSAVRPGHVLRPEFDSEAQAVRWVMEDTHGNTGPANFGRAPGPTLWSATTPSISPTSNDSSPRRTREETPRGWTIASVLASSDYSWAGGDGKEIKFLGFAPHAERDPNSAVAFSMQGRTANVGIGPRMIGGSEDDNSAPLAPRARRQWAEKMDSPMIPCGTMEFVEAVEIPSARDYMPGSMWDATQLPARCFDCTSPPIAQV